MQCDPALPAIQGQEWSDVQQRFLFCKMLIVDFPQQLSQITGKKPGEELDFGNDIKSLAASVCVRLETNNTRAGLPCSQNSFVTCGLTRNI